MHDFQYVTKKTAAPVKEELLQLIHEVQDEVRKKFTFRYDFIGSSSRNMITQDMKSNIGFDFDVNFEVNDDEQNFSPKEIRLTIKNAIDKVAPKYGYSPCEDSTRVLTIKKVDRKRSRIIHSCDIAIVNNFTNDNGEEDQEYIRFEKRHPQLRQRPGELQEHRLRPGEQVLRSLHLGYGGHHLQPEVCG